MVKNLVKTENPEHDFNHIGIYSIWDKKGKKFDVPFFAANQLFARRRFLMMAKEESILKEFINDFDLCYIGKFNLINGHLEKSFEKLIEGKQIKKEDLENEK